jgi:hypothetical protein
VLWRSRNSAKRAPAARPSHRNSRYARRMVRRPAATASLAGACGSSSTVKVKPAHVTNFDVDSRQLRTCPQHAQRRSTAKSPSYPKVIHRHRSVISLPNTSSRDNVSLTDARHEPPGNGSQTTKQSARPCQARVAKAKAAQGQRSLRTQGLRARPSDGVGHSVRGDAAKRR